MQTIQKKYRSSFREKGSKFMGYLFSVASQQIFDEKLNQIKNDYPDATHHCYGWRISPNKLEEFAQDDGEPSGTAGLPILNQLKSFEAVNCGCVVVRYYGGTNLGKSGLIQAYGEATNRCLTRASFLKLISTQNFRINYDYAQQNKINQLKNTFDLKELNAEYLERVSLDIACRSGQAEDFRKALKQKEHLNITSKKLGPGFVTIA